MKESDYTFFQLMFKEKNPTLRVRNRPFGSDISNVSSVVLWA